MSANQTINPTQTLANDSRAQLEPWLEEFETHARNLCAQHDATGAPTLVASDQVWNSIPANQTTAVRLAAETLHIVTARPGIHLNPTPTTLRLP
jgi:hypothetical protein